MAGTCKPTAKKVDITFSGIQQKLSNSWTMVVALYTRSVKISTRAMAQKSVIQDSIIGTDVSETIRRITALQSRNMPSSGIRVTRYFYTGVKHN